MFNNTRLISPHPSHTSICNFNSLGGPGYLKDYLHKDASEKFHYFGHSERAIEMVNEMAIGILKKEM